MIRVGVHLKHFTIFYLILINDKGWGSFGSIFCAICEVDTHLSVQGDPSLQELNTVRSSQLVARMRIQLLENNKVSFFKPY